MKRYKLLIYGTGNYCRILLDNLDDKKTEITAYVETFPDKEMFMGRPVLNKDMVDTSDYDLLIIAASADNEILQQLKNIDKRKIIRMTWKAFICNEIGMTESLMRAFYCLKKNGRLWRLLLKYLCNQLDISCVELDDAFYWTNRLDYIAKCMLFQNKVYSKYEMDRFIYLSKKYYKNDGGGILLDCGCNIGTTSIYMTHQVTDLEVIAYEPIPKNSKLSVYNAIVNGVEEDIKIISKGLSNKQETFCMQMAEDNSGANKVILDGTSERTISVEATDVDSFLMENGIAAERIAYIWMDVEGFEGYVLAGMKKLLGAKRIPLFTEFNKQLLVEHDCYELFLSQVKTNYTRFIEVNAFVEEKELSVDRIEGIERSTNLFLIA